MKRINSFRFSAPQKLWGCLKSMFELQPIQKLWGCLKSMFELQPIQKLWGRLKSMFELQPIQKLWGCLKSMFELQPIQKLWGRLKSMFELQPIQKLWGCLKSMFELQPIQNLWCRLKSMRTASMVSLAVVLILVNCGGVQTNDPLPGSEFNSLPAVTELIDFEFGFQSASAFIEVTSVNDKESTVNIRNLYNVANPLEQDRRGTLGLKSLPAGYVTDLQSPLVIEDPEGSAATNVKLGEFSIAVESIDKPLNGAIRKYTVMADFSASMAPLLPIDISVEYMAGITGAVVSETPSIAVTDTKIVISDVTNPPETYDVTGRITIAERPAYFTADQTTVSFGSLHPTGIAAATVSLEQKINVTNVYTKVVTTYEVEVQYSAKAYLGLGAADITAVFEQGRVELEDGLPARFVTLATANGNISIEGTTIVVSGFTNGSDNIQSRVRIEVTDRSNYFKTTSSVIVTGDAIGLRDATIRPTDTFSVTNVFDNSVVEYGLRVDYEGTPLLPYADAPVVYMTEIYQKSSNEFVVEIYVEDVPGEAESVSLSNYGLRSFWARVNSNTPGLTPAVGNAFPLDFTISTTGDIGLYEGVFYNFVYIADDALEVNPRPPDTIYLKYSSGNNDRIQPAFSTECAVFELFEIRPSAISSDLSEFRTLDYVRLGSACPAYVGEVAYAPATWNAGNNPPDLNQLYTTTGTLIESPTGTPPPTINNGSIMSLSRKIVKTEPLVGFMYESTIAGSRSGADYNFSASEWEIAVQTRSLPSDAGCVMAENANDNDKDGIYDCLEDAPTDTFFGMPLTAWGATSSKVDLFLEVDYMDCMNSLSSETQPYEAVIEKMVDNFASNNINLHVDIGNLYDGNAGTNAAKYDLGGGNSYLSSSGDLTNYNGIALGTGPNAAIFYRIKEDHFSIIRKQLFYYMVFAKTGLPNVRGLGELPGNDTLITLALAGASPNPGHYNCASANGELVASANRDTLQADIQISQYYTMVHELGHNLGLGHGGGDSTNYKPNYKSVMNYGYRYFGTASPGLLSVNGWEVSNYYRIGRLANYQPCIARYPTYPQAPNTLAVFEVHFSDGSASRINEFNLNETVPLFATGTTVDYDCDGSTETSVAFDVNFDGTMGLLEDYNDVANMGSIFYKYDYIPNILNADAVNYELTPFFGPSKRPANALLVPGAVTGGSPLGQTILSDRQPVIEIKDESKFFKSVFEEATIHHDHDHDHDHGHDHDSGDHHDSNVGDHQSFFKMVVHFFGEKISRLAVWVNAFLENF
ncbi:hypothetical protein COTS27_00670 [Spirochaetota bacterium]|nr:hypothetical protein COTS27_00670 [Spirochaetota bacterium]